MTRFDDSPAAKGLCFPPEWSVHRECLIGWPVLGERFVETLDYARQTVSTLARHMADYEPVSVVVRPEDRAEAQLACGPEINLVEEAYDTCWLRDIGPSFLMGDKNELAATCWRFNGWGNRLPHQQDQGFGERLLRHTDIRSFDCPLVLEGGSFEIDGHGTLFADRNTLQSKNRNPTLTEQQIEERLAFFLGVRKVIWLEGHFDQDMASGHIGLCARFAGQDRVLINRPQMELDPNWQIALGHESTFRALSSRQGLDYELIDVPQPAAKYDLDGRRLPLSYLDFYFANGAVILPAFDDPLDDEIYRLFSSLFPGREICQIDVLPLIYSGGGIHRITSQQPGSPED
jgi:agmatine deiminase